jgi:BON domain
MNRTQNRFKESRPPVEEKSTDLKPKRTEFPDFPAFSGDSSLYIEEIHYRAETVTPVLKGIPGYLHGNGKNEPIWHTEFIKIPTIDLRGPMKTDTKLKEALVAQLNFWVGRSADNVQVTASDGIVILRGSVPNDSEKMECEETVRRAGGVRQVVNKVVVKRPEPQGAYRLTPRLALPKDLIRRQQFA